MYNVARNKALLSKVLKLGRIRANSLMVILVFYYRMLNGLEKIALRNLRK